jgi:hypothetical protein
MTLRWSLANPFNGKTQRTYAAITAECLRARRRGTKRWRAHPVNSCLKQSGIWAKIKTHPPAMARLPALRPALNRRLINLVRLGSGLLLRCSDVRAIKGDGDATTFNKWN